MYLYGKNSILERLRVNPRSIKKIFLRENFNAPDIFKLVGSKKIPTKRVSEKKLGRVKHASRLQGIVAEVDDFIYADFEELLHKGSEKKLSLIFLDSISDPHNLGSIMRIAACFGGFAIVIPKYNACEVNDTVMHVASGGENFVPVSMVSNISTALFKAKKADWWIVGAVVRGGKEISSISLPFPMCLVLGSEDKGIRYGIERQLDLKVSLPMRGISLSLNVAMACAIFCHEMAKQKFTNKRGNK